MHGVDVVLLDADFRPTSTADPRGSTLGASVHVEIWGAALPLRTTIYVLQLPVAAPRATKAARIGLLEVLQEKHQHQHTQRI